MTFIATATVTDKEMAERIARHKIERPVHWKLIEEPLNLSQAIREVSSGIIIVDCLTLWLNNQLFSLPEQDFDGLYKELTHTISNSPCDIFLIANEVGLGVIPMGSITRQFVDQAGWLNQALAAHAEKVSFIVAGLPMTLKG